MIVSGWRECLSREQSEAIVDSDVEFISITRSVVDLKSHWRFVSLCLCDVYLSCALEDAM